jgi:hypothetical protein
MSEQEYLTVEVHKEFSERIDAEEKRQNKRLDKLEDGFGQLAKLTSALEVMANNMENMAKEQAKQGERLEVIESKPAQNWEKLVWAIGGAILTAVIAFILKQIGI